MYKYEMGPTRTVGATVRTRDVRLMDGRMEWNQIPPPPHNNFVVCITTSQASGFQLSFLVYSV